MEIRDRGRDWCRSRTTSRTLSCPCLRALEALARALAGSLVKHVILSAVVGRLLIWETVIACSPGAGNYMDQALTPVSDDGDETLEQRDGSINGNTAASIAMTASRFTSNMWRHVGSKAPDCSGALLSKVHPPLERMSIFATAFRSSHGTGPGTSVVLVRWIRPVAFLGTAARARPCGHAFFVFRFLARGSAGTDVSFTRRAGRGLALSRRNKRRAEERSYDKSRDCKFGSHQKDSQVG
jgi:hypothetical protein